MIHRRRSNIVLFLCLQAMAVAIICLGSLINFHQYKIWGKPLIPNFVGYKRDVEKLSKTISLDKFNHAIPHDSNFFTDNDCELPVDLLFFQYPNVSGIILVEFTPPFPLRQVITSSGLRGPPIS